MMRTYTELIQIPTFEERYKYLRLGGGVGKETFGFERYLNQRFYHSTEWRRVRQEIIARDMGCDLAVPGREIAGRILIHHLNPVKAKDIADGSDLILNPEYLVCVSKLTHDAIHFSDDSILYHDPIVRTPNDTCLWLT